ncbi:alpha/beta fold hydrolase [Zhongshania arctica]|uniref:Alpha/beta fold hydrolase n=1 Tax=Zhongshania arctica TaxID=3238302 RepID=A0ABV3TXL0_9GAMM
MTIAKRLRIVVIIACAIPTVIVAACYIAPLPTAASLTALQRAATGVSHREIQLPSGASIAYLDSDIAAPADKPVLLLLHGITSNKDIWLQLISHFDSYRVIAVDMPGHGDSRETEDFDYRVENLSQQIAVFIETLSLPPAHLVGNSLGGLVAALYSVEHPNRVKSLVLMNSAGIDAPQRSAMMQRAMDDRSYNPLVVETMDDIAPKLAAVLAHPPTLMAPIRQLMLAQELSRLEANNRLFSAVLADESNINKLELLLPRLTTPAMLLWGDSDQVFHYSSVAKAIDLAPALGAHIIEDCGHLPMLEAPAKSAAVLHGFFHTPGLVQASTEPTPEVMSAG